MPTTVLVEEMRAAYRAGRDHLVQRLRLVLETDERVAASWLWGSLGRGTGDDFSDLDIWVVVRDTEMPAVCAARREFATQIGDTLLFVEAMQNAPRGGAYLMAAYDGVYGPYLADWYWQPQAQALGIPSDAFVLTNRASLPATGKPTQIQSAEPEDIAAAHPPRTSEQKRTDEISNSISLFWAMLLISAKYILRQRNDETLFLRDMLQNLLRDAHQFAGISHQETGSITPNSAVTKAALLHQLAKDMERVTARLETRESVHLPVTIPEAVRRYLAMVEAVGALDELRAGAVPPPPTLFGDGP